VVLVIRHVRRDRREIEGPAPMTDAESPPD